MSCSRGPAPTRSARSSRGSRGRARPRGSCSTMSDLTVAVTGPTGEIGRAFLRALDPHVGRILGMARRPFDPASLGLHNTEYRQGDILDPEALRELFAEADVIVHL